VGQLRIKIKALLQQGDTISGELYNLSPERACIPVSHALVKNHIHFVFSTKDRQEMISKDARPELWSYLAGISRNQE
jgi:hypothetical protein